MARERDDDNPLGLGPRDRESSNTGSTADTSYNAEGADPYTTGEPRKDVGDRTRDARGDAPSSGRSTKYDPETTSSDEP